MLRRLLFMGISPRRHGEAEEGEVSQMQNTEGRISQDPADDAVVQNRNAEVDEQADALT